MANELILIIEDNEVNRILVRDMLRFKGIRRWRCRVRKRAFASHVQKALSSVRAAS